MQLKWKSDGDQRIVATRGDDAYLIRWFADDECYILTLNGEEVQRSVSRLALQMVAQRAADGEQPQ